MKFCWLVLTFSSLAFGWASLPQFAIFQTTACLLSYRESGVGTELKCWEVGGKTAPIEYKSVAHPLAIGAYNHGLCVIDGGSLRCGDLSRPRRTDRLQYEAFPGLAKHTDLTAFVSYAFEICARNQAGELFCEGAYGDYTSKPIYHFDVPKNIHAADNFPGSFDVAHSVGCAIDDQKAIHCWSAREKGKACAAALTEHAPKDLTAPAQIVVDTRAHADDCRACVLDRDAVRCWKDSGVEDPIAFPGLRHDVSPASNGIALFESPREKLTMPDGSVCVDTGGTSTCRNEQGKMIPVDLPFPALFWETTWGPYLAQYNYLCGVTETELRCECNIYNQSLNCKSKRREVEPWRVTHGQWLNGAGAQSLAPTLRFLAPHVYRAPAALLLAAADLLPPGDDLELRALFVIEALDPLIAATTSPFFDATVHTPWRNMKAHEETVAGIGAITAIPSRIGLPATLSLLRAALPATRTALGGEPTDYELALGQATTNPTESLAKLVATTRALRPRLDTAAATPSGDASTLHTVEILWDYLASLTSAPR